MFLDWKIKRAEKHYQTYGYSELRTNLFEESLLDFQTGRIIDLGAGHCSFSLKANSLGWEVTALDIRQNRKPSLPKAIKYISGDLNSDVWDSTNFDVICLLGVYYHLDQVSQHKLLNRIKGKNLILDTHVSTEMGNGLFELRNQVGSLVEQNGEKGRNFFESPGVSSEKRKAQELLASYENDESWWPTEKSLIATLRSFGWQEISIKSHNLKGAQRIFLTAKS
jgi:hypothetical protein